MATITQQQAVDRLTQAVNHAHPDDLVEIYNELFPEKPITEDVAKENPSAVVEKIVAHVDSGLEVEEILDLWNVIFPTHRRVWFDEEEELMHYDEQIEPVAQAEDDGTRKCSEPGGSPNALQQVFPPGAEAFPR
jgi:hypothetical protein